MSCISKSFFVLFAIFILHSRESELYCYTLDGKSALAWELPFSRFLWATCLLHKGGAVPLSALPKDTTSELAGLFSTTFPKCQAGKLRMPFLKVFWYDSTREMNPRSTDYKADALTTTPLRRSTDYNPSTFSLTFLFSFYLAPPSPSSFFPRSLLLYFSRVHTRVALHSEVCLLALRLTQSLSRIRFLSCPLLSLQVPIFNIATSIFPTCLSVAVTASIPQSTAGLTTL